MDSNVGALKNKIAQLRRLVADLRGELGEVLTRQNDIEKTFEERLKLSPGGPRLGQRGVHPVEDRSSGE